MATNKTQVNLSIPEDALQKLDAMAQAHLHSRNVEFEYLIRLAWRHFQQADQVQLMPAIDDPSAVNDEGASAHSQVRYEQS